MSHASQGRNRAGPDVTSPPAVRPWDALLGERSEPGNGRERSEHHPLPPPPAPPLPSQLLQLTVIAAIAAAGRLACLLGLLMGPTLARCTYIAIC